MGLNQRGTQKPDERGDDAEPAENDLYVPRKASSEVWNAFRLSVADPNRAWCTICHVWLAWRKTTSNLLLHCSSFHVTDPQGRQRRRDRSGRTESSISLNLLSPSIESSGEWRDPGVLEPSKDNEHSGNAVTVSSSCKISEEALQDSADLYVPHDIQSNAWESFRLSRNHANRAWCIHCKVWQRWNNDVAILENHVAKGHLEATTPCTHAAQSMNINEKRIDDFAEATEKSSTAAEVSQTMPALKDSMSEVLERSSNAQVQDFLDFRRLPATSQSDSGSSHRNNLADADMSHVEEARHLSPSRSTLPYAPETVEFLVRDLLPPAILDGVGFQKFAHKISSAGSWRPEYAPIDQRALLQELESLHTTVSNRVAQILLSAGSAIALSVELWPQCDFATVYAHCLHSASLRPLKITLLVYHLKRRKSCATYSPVRQTCDYNTQELEPVDPFDDIECNLHGQGISSPEDDPSKADALIIKALVEALRAWKIPPSNILAVTTSSVTLSSAHIERSTGIKTHIPCIGSVLNGVVSKALRKHEEVLHRASRTMNVSCMSCVTDNWIQYIQLFKRTVDRTELHLMAGDDMLTEIQLDDNAVMKSLIPVLNAAEEAAIGMCQEQGHVPLSIVLRALDNLVHVASNVSIGRDVERSVSETALEVAQSLSDVFSCIISDQAEKALLCIVLDPRLKSVIATPHGQSTYGIGDGGVSEVLRRHLRIEVSSTYDMGLEHSIDSEVEMYLAENVAPSGVQIGNWWAGRTGKYRLLKRLAQRTLPIPGLASGGARMLRSCMSASPDKDTVMAMRRRGLCQLSDVSPAYIQTVVFLNNNLDL